VSRATNSVLVGLLASRPFTVDGYRGEGLCLAVGLLGRNEGLHTPPYVFDLEDALKIKRGIIRDRQNTRIGAELENTSSWALRSNKVVRSYVFKSIDEQFGTLLKDFRNFATKLSLVILEFRTSLCALRHGKQPTHEHGHVHTIEPHLPCAALASRSRNESRSDYR
jgi:hypothetical protein